MQTYDEYVTQFTFEEVGVTSQQFFEEIEIAFDTGKHMKVYFDSKEKAIVSIDSPVIQHFVPIISDEAIDEVVKKLAPFGWELSVCQVDDGGYIELTKLEDKR